MTNRAWCFVHLRELSEMSIFVTRLTLDRDSLILKAFYSTDDLLLVTISAPDCEVFSNKNELRRDVIEGHRLPVLHGVTSGTAQIRHEPVEHPVVPVGVTRFAADIVEPEYRFLLSRFLVAIIARNCSMGPLQWKSRIRMPCDSKQ